MPRAIAPESGPTIGSRLPGEAQRLWVQMRSAVLLALRLDLGQQHDVGDDAAIQRRGIRPVDLHEVPRRVAKVHLSLPARELDHPGGERHLIAERKLAELNVHGFEVLQKKLQETVVEGSSGGGSVTVKMDGRKQVLSIKIDPEVVKLGCLRCPVALEEVQLLMPER